MAERKYKTASEHVLAGHPDYVKNIGMVSLETVDLELRLASLLGRIIGISLKVARSIYLSPKAETARLDILEHAAKAALTAKPNTRRKREALEKVVAIVKRSRALIGQRHRIIHDEWNVSDKEKTITRRMIDGTHDRTSVPVEAKELPTLIQNLRELIDDTYDLSEEFKEHPPTMVSMALNKRD